MEGSYIAKGIVDCIRVHIYLITKGASDYH